MEEEMLEDRGETTKESFAERESEGVRETQQDCQSAKGTLYVGSHKFNARPLSMVVWYSPAKVSCTNKSPEQTENTFNMSWSFPR